MSKALSRVRALVSEIDLIQNDGRKSASPVPVVRAIQPENPAPESPKVVQMTSRQPEVSTQQAVSPEGKVFLQLTGKIAVQLQLEHSEEIVEIRQLNENIEIRFADGKAIHLPLKSVA